MSFHQTFKAGLIEIRHEMRERRRAARDHKNLTDSGRRMPWNPLAAVALFALLAALYAALAGSHLSIAYVDLGDGNYLYTSSRMTDGLQIYRDFLSPQPPMHLLTGSALVRLGRALQSASGSMSVNDIPLPLICVRVFSICLRILAGIMLFLIGRRVTQTPWGGALAGGLYLFLPLGFWWSQGYQSEPLEIFFLLAALALFLPLTPRRMAAAGLLMALSVLTNMTAAPYALAMLTYLVIRHAIQGGRAGLILTACYLLPMAVGIGAVAGGYEAATGAYFRNVVGNQVASYPPEGFWGYGFPKLIEQSYKVIAMEGALILFALLGLSLYNRVDTRPEREFFVWYALVLLLSIAYVTKGGTMDYIFTIGEPMVALFAAHFIVNYFHPATLRRFFRHRPWLDTSWFPQAAFFGILLFVGFYPGYRFIRDTLAQEQYEQSVQGVEKISFLINRYSRPGDKILVPPYYAFLTRRLLVEEYSELYLWSMKYRVERQSGKAGEGVYKVIAIANQLRQRKVPIVIANTDRPLLLLSPEIRSAMAEFYKPLLKEKELIQTMNFQMQVYLPKTDEELKAREEINKTTE